MVPRHEHRTKPIEGPQVENSENNSEFFEFDVKVTEFPPKPANSDFRNSE